MSYVSRAWNHLEEALIALLLATMTLVTFVYVILNNLYTPFYALGDHFETGRTLCYAIGDFIITLAQAMTWSSSLTKALFAWLIFFGTAYGVRTAGHIGIDALVKRTSKPTQRILGLIACACCLFYAGLLCIASFDWVKTLLIANIGAEDLDQIGIKQWHIGLIVPLGFALVFIRFGEILVRILRHQQTGLGLADEAADALKLQQSEQEPRP